MKLFRFTVTVLSGLVSLFAAGCSDDEGIDNRDHDYGYVQFKLYKEASYETSAGVSASSGRMADSRAVRPRLDYLAEAKKVKVTLAYDDTTIAQTLNLASADKESAEYGLRSDKLRLLTGEYHIVTFILYDADDEPIYNGSASDETLLIVAGGLTSHDLTVDVTPRGSVRFSLVKANVDKTPAVRAASREYTFDEIAFVNITVQNRTTNERTTFSQLPMTFSVHFDENNDEDGTFGYQTSSSSCDSLLSLPAGNYRIAAYETLDEQRTLLESNSSPATTEFVVEDNRTTDVKAGITLDLAAEYIRDYYALRDIWAALDGGNWYYAGEDYATGANWDFNKDVDLWGDQPGVQLHSNGRVARIDLSGFGFRGDMPEALGQLDQLVELYLGTHNDTNGLEYDPSLSPDKSLAERKRNRIEYNKQYLAMIHPATQFSEPCARALSEHNIHIPATSLYEQGYTESQLIDPQTGLQHRIAPKDIVYGKLCNGLRSLPESIRNLKNLEIIYIANGELETLPEGFAELEACTDIEIYNCPKMTNFPDVLARMPMLEQLNLSNNRQWSENGTLFTGLKALAEGPSAEQIQILYCTDCGLTEIPESFNRLSKLALLDCSNNKISKLYPLGADVAPVQLYLDNNLIEEIPTDENGIYCTINDAETISIRQNKLREFPNIFNANSRYQIASVDLSLNEIDRMPEGFKGIYVETLTLTGNRFTEFPKAFAASDSRVAYIILRACDIASFPEGAFADWKYSADLVSLDLSYNHLTAMSNEFIATNLPYLYGLDISYNSFASFPWQPLDCMGLTVFAIRGQRNDAGERCLREWPTGLYQHTGLRGFYIGSNDLRKVDDTISYMIYYLDISDNPNIIFDASDICAYWRAGYYYLIYDKTQDIVNCDYMLE